MLKWVDLEYRSVVTEMLFLHFAQYLQSAIFTTLVLSFSGFVNCKNWTQCKNNNIERYSRTRWTEDENWYVTGHTDCKFCAVCKNCAKKKKILFNDTQEEMRFDMSHIFVLGENSRFPRNYESKREKWVPHSLYVISRKHIILKWKMASPYENRKMLSVYRF